MDDFWKALGFVARFAIFLVPGAIVSAGLYFIYRLLETWSERRGYGPLIVGYALTALVLVLAVFSWTIRGWLVGFVAVVWFASFSRYDKDEVLGQAFGWAVVGASIGFAYDLHLNSISLEWPFTALKRIGL